MYKLIYFLRNSYVTILFIVIEIIAINCYASSDDFTRARMVGLSHRVTGSVQNFYTGATSYFSLRRENAQLVSRVAELENRLELYRDNTSEVPFEVDSTLLGSYQYMQARIVSNSVNRRDNMIVLNKGMRDGVTTDMAVLAPDGSIVGYLVDCSERYSVAVSVLNTSFKTGGKISGDGYFGLIEWDGKDANHVVMRNLSKYAPIELGAAVTTTGFSFLFPADMPIGTVESYELSATHTTYDVVVRLQTDITKLYNVILVRNLNQDEARGLEESARNGLKQ